MLPTEADAPARVAEHWLSCRIQRTGLMGLIWRITSEGREILHPMRTPHPVQELIRRVEPPLSAPKILSRCGNELQLGALVITFHL